MQNGSHIYPAPTCSAVRVHAAALETRISLQVAAVLSLVGRIRLARFAQLERRWQTLIETSSKRHDHTNCSKADLGVACS